MKVLVAIPSYTCEKQVGRVIAGFDKSLLKRVSKVIVINDVSKDNTGQVAYEAVKKLGSPKVEVVENDVNLGLGGSHKMAFLYGEKMGADYVAILHGDDQAKTPELNNLLDVIENDAEVGAVLGSRFMTGSKLDGYDWKRIWGNRVLNLLYTIVTFKNTKDLGSGLNIFRMADLKDHRFLGFDDRMTFNFDLLLDYYTKHTKIVFVPITWTEEDQVTNARNFNVAKRAFNQLMKWRFGMLKFDPKPAKNYTSHTFKPGK